MAKVSREVLKSVVKECLIEILSEGLISSINEVNDRKADPSFLLGENNKRKQSTRRPKRKNKQQQNPKQDHKIKAAINEVASDPLMREIFADTAQTTLQVQAEVAGASGMLVNPTQRARGVEEQVVAQTEISDIFGDSDQWSKWAFGQ